MTQLPKSLGTDETSERDSGWRLFDSQFKKYRAQYFKQTAMATVAMDSGS